MPYVYVYECDACKFDPEIVLSEEFIRQADGTRVRYEYPHPDVYEWPPRRVSGLRSHLWCPDCRVSREHVLVELDEPAEHPVQAFLSAEARGLTGAETGPCPACGSDLAVDIEGAPCPRCGQGVLRLIGEYEP